MLKVQMNGVIYEIDHISNISEFVAINQATGQSVSDPNTLAGLFATGRQIDYLQKAINPIDGFLYDLRDGAILEQDALQQIVQQENYETIFSTTSSLFLDFATGSLAKTDLLTEIGKLSLDLGSHSAKRLLLLSLTDAYFNQANQDFLEAYAIWPQLQQPDMIINANQVKQATISALEASEQFLLRTNLIATSDITESDGFWSDYLDFWLGIGATLLPQLLKTEWALASDAFKNMQAVADFAKESLDILGKIKWGTGVVVNLIEYTNLLEAINIPATDKQTLINQAGLNQILAAFVARENTLPVSDIRIDTYTDASQFHYMAPSMTTLPDGGFVVTPIAHLEKNPLLLFLMVSMGNAMMLKAMRRVQNFVSILILLIINISPQ